MQLIAFLIVFPLIIAGVLLLVKSDWPRNIIVGAAAVCALRFVCSWLSGMLIWGSYQAYYEWAANLPIWLYSLIYNGNYLLPETVLTVIGAVLLVRGAPKLFDRQAA